MSNTILLLLLIILLIYLLVDKKKRSNTYVSMTSENSHLPFIHKTIDSLLNGSHIPHKIILNIPNHTVQIPHNLILPKYNKKLIIQRCNNFKQGNHILPTLINRHKLGINNRDNILVTSEKIDYPTDFVKNMVDKCNKKNTAIVNKSINKKTPSVIFKSFTIHNLDTNIPSEEEEQDKNPIPSEESIDNTAEENYNVRLPTILENTRNIHDKDVSNAINNDNLPYDNKSSIDIYNNHSLKNNKYDITEKMPDDLQQFNDDAELNPIPKITIDRNKKLIQPDTMYVRKKCNPQNETCSYTKNQFNNKFSRIDFIPDAKKFTIVKKHLDMNSIEPFTI